MAGAVNNIIGADELARQNVAIKNGGVVPQPVTQNDNIFSAGGVIGRFEQPVVQQVSQNTSVGQSSFPPMADLADKTPQNVTNFASLTQPSPSTGLNQDSSRAIERGLSQALGGGNYYESVIPESSDFTKDDTKRDGGFFSWLRGLAQKARPGRRDGETDEEYDRRMTTNRKRLFALGDAMRHIGNIVNTGKGAPAQVFNSPVDDEEKRYRQRQADRAAKAAAAQKAAELSLKEKAAEADRQYKLLLLGQKGKAQGLAEDKFKYQQGKDVRDFDEKKRHNTAIEALGEGKLAVARYNATHKGSGKSGSGGGKSGSGSGGKYWFDDKKGKRHFLPNKTMLDMEFFKEYGHLPNDGTSTSTTTETKDWKTGKTTTTTTRTTVNSTALKAKAQKDAAAARKATEQKATEQKSSGKKQSGDSFKNFKL